MSLESAIEFLDLMNEKPGLQTRLNELAEAGGEATCDDVVHVAKNLGFTFSLEELHEALELGRESSDELTDEELAQVAGGVGTRAKARPNLQWANRRTLSMRYALGPTSTGR